MTRVSDDLTTSGPAAPLPADATLLVIDVQVGLDDPRLGRRDNPAAEANIAELLAAWRASGRPVVHVQHLSTEPNSPLRPELPGVAIKPEVAPLPGEPVFTKQVNSAFIGTGLEAWLRDAGRDTLVITGLTANQCVETTTRMAGNLGFIAYLVGDATASFDRTGPDGVFHLAELIHSVSLANLHGEFATVVSTVDMLDRTGT
ncbi:MAG: cysteine hydrolase family protein, partial [Thermomicrobiales bacterium]